MREKKNSRQRCVKTLVGDTVNSSFSQFCPQSKAVRCVLKNSQLKKSFGVVQHNNNDNRGKKKIEIKYSTKMQSQEEIRFCEPADDLNHIFSYENDLKSQLHRPFYHQNGLAKQPSSQLIKGSPHTDNYGRKNTTHQLNSDTVCVCLSLCVFCSCYFFFFSSIRTAQK